MRVTASDGEFRDIGPGDVWHMEDKHGKQMDAALGSGYFVRMQLPPSANAQSLLARYI